MSGKFKRILYGGDYNPNQWPKEIWKEDMAYFKAARINSATINVFSWARLQPSEDVYDFSQLDEIVGTYEKDFYKGMPAVTRNTYGKGAVYYVGTRLEEEGLYKVMDMAAEEGKVTSLSTEPTGLEIICRKGENSSFYFLINFKDQPEKIPEAFAGDADLLTGKVIGSGEMMEKYEVRLIEKA